jgi:lysozyme
MTLLGIDVSKYQGAVNWHAVAGSSVKFAFARATQDTSYVDPWFVKNWAGIQEVGLYRGAYHYGRPGSDPESQAAHFAAVVGQLGFRDLPPVLDLEQSDGHDKNYVLEWARTFVNKAEALFGRKLIIYTGYFWRGPMQNPNDPFFRERPLWLAAYNNSPVVPASWEHWTFWQYSEGQHNGPVSIPGLPPCDQDRFAGAEADLDKLCSGNSPIAAPPPIPNGTEWPGTHFVWPTTPAVAGPAVKLWQGRIKERGYIIDCDGVYGPQSKAACIAFQRDHGLVADGIVGRATWSATFA